MLMGKVLWCCQCRTCRLDRGPEAAGAGKAGDVEAGAGAEAEVGKYTTEKQSEAAAGVRHGAGAEGGPARWLRRRRQYWAPSPSRAAAADSCACNLEGSQEQATSTAAEASLARAAESF